MLTYQSPLAEPTSADDPADWQQRREDLRIRPLIEFPRLRAAMGMTEFPTPAAAAPAVKANASKAKAKKPAKRMPSTSSSPATSTRTKHAVKATDRHLDRRTLLETDR